MELADKTRTHSGVFAQCLLAWFPSGEDTIEREAAALRVAEFINAFTRK